MLPDALVLESSNLSNKESVDLYVEENDPELELRLVSSTRSSTHSPRSHDMSSPFITNPQSPQQEGPSHSGVSREDKNTSRKQLMCSARPGRLQRDTRILVMNWGSTHRSGTNRLLTIHLIIQIKPR